jgi:hypothetical protein
MIAIMVSLADRWAFVHYLNGLRSIEVLLHKPVGCATTFAAPCNQADLARQGDLQPAHDLGPRFRKKSVFRAISNTQRGPVSRDL